MRGGTQGALSMWVVNSDKVGACDSSMPELCNYPYRLEPITYVSPCITHASPMHHPCIPYRVEPITHVSPCITMHHHASPCITHASPMHPAHLGHVYIHHFSVLLEKRSYCALTSLWIEVPHLPPQVKNKSPRIDRYHRVFEVQFLGRLILPIYRVSCNMCRTWCCDRTCYDVPIIIVHVCSNGPKLTMIRSPSWESVRCATCG